MILERSAAKVCLSGRLVGSGERHDASKHFRLWNLTRSLPRCAGQPSSRPAALGPDRDGTAPRRERRALPIHFSHRQPRSVAHVRSGTARGRPRNSGHGRGSRRSGSSCAHIAGSGRDCPTRRNEDTIVAVKRLRPASALSRTACQTSARHRRWPTACACRLRRSPCPACFGLSGAARTWQSPDCVCLRP